jgi:NADP-dependent 3-hydroxy acid dehydrogenase YdfG
MSSIQNKVIWITGASSGIGEALVYECAKQNAKIILSARRESELVRVSKAANLSASDFLI